MQTVTRPQAHRASSARSPTAWPLPAAGSTSRSSRGSTLRRPARWSWWRWSRRSASWTGPAWRPARARWRCELWKGRLPERDPAELVRELYAEENRGKPEPSGSQDMIGLIYPGREPPGLRLSPRGRRLPRRTSSRTTIPAIARWLEQVIHMVPVAPRPEGYNPLGVKNLDPPVDSAGWARRARTATTRSSRRDVAGPGRLDERVHGVLGGDPAAHGPASRRSPSTCRRFWAITSRRYPGAMYSGCGGGYLYVVSAEEVPGSLRIKVRTRAEINH